MPKFVFTTMAGARYSAEAMSEVEAKDAILKAHPWVRRWDLIEDSSVNYSEVQRHIGDENDPHWFS